MKKYCLWLTILSGILTVLLYRGFTNMLVWVYLVPVLIVILSVDVKKMVWYMALYSIIVVAFSLWWVSQYSYYILALVLLFLTLFHIGLGVLTKTLIKKTGFLEVFIPPFVWILGYYILSLTPLDNFWVNMGVFHTEAAPLVWYGGSLGIAFTIVLFNSSIAFLILKKRKAYLAVAVVIAVIMLSCFVYSNSKEPWGEKLKVALIQGNFPQGWDYRVENAKTEVYATYKQLTYQALKGEPDLIIWPEYSIPVDISKDEKFSREFIGFTKTVDSNLLLGTLKDVDNTSHYDFALMLLKDSDEVLNYTSVRPIPYEVDTKGWDKLETMETPFAKLGIVMCYEETQREIAREHAKNSAEFLVALSNNQRFGRTNGIFLASLYSKAIAAENGKYLVRATNTGISQVVNPQGVVVESIKPFSRGVLVAEIYLDSGKTFYTQHGNLLLNLFIIVLSILVVKSRLGSGNPPR